MPSKCVVCGAAQNKNALLRFHRFPKNEDIREKWAKACNLQISKITSSTIVCSKHFRQDDYDHSFWPNSRLLPFAVPSPSTIYKTQNVGTVTSSLPSEAHDKREIQCSPVPSTSSSNVYTLIDVPQKLLTAETEPSTSSSFTCKSTPSCPRYVGDLKPEHFSTPRKAKRNLDMLKGAFESQRKKLKVIQVQKRRLAKRIEDFKDLLQHLANAKIISEEVYSHMIEGIPDEVKHIVSRQLKSKNAKYSPEVRTFALTLHFYSPKAYAYVRRSFNNLLPHPSTIQRWYSVLDGEPGFTKEALDAIKKKSAEKNIIVNLVLDEIHIRQFVEWNGKSYEGYVDHGTAMESNEMATSALVFMATAVNDKWKVPIGYFLVKTLSADERANLLKTGLELLYESGVECQSITFDGASSNISMCNKLGTNYCLNDFKPWFLHPITKEKVYTFWDACHMLKLCRNTLGDKHILLNSTGQRIKWSVIEQLNELQKREGLHAGNKITDRHINFQNEKMKVRLAAQTLSVSVSDAIKFCNFEDGDGTAEFCRNINDAFDILNSMNIFAKYQYKQPLSIKNYEIFKSRIESLIEYLKNLYDNAGHLLLESNRKTGFLGFIVDLTNILNLYDDMITTGKLYYLLSYKFSQDHLETFFSAIRSRGGFNNNPTARQFKAAYKRLLVHHELATSPNANCTILDATTILHVGSSLKSRTTDTAYSGNVELYEHLDETIDHLISLSSFVSNVTTYISGFVMKKILPKITCFTCKKYLNESNVHHEPLTLLRQKNRGKLIVPHPDVAFICEQAEKIIRMYKKDLHKKSIVNYIKLKSLQYASNTFSSPEIFEHLLNQDILDNHKIQIVKLIIEMYFKIRINYECKLQSRKPSRVRHKFTKLILFKNE